MEKTKILILDEDKEYTKIMSRILVEHDFITHIAYSPLHAQNLLKTTKIDFFIIDIFQPAWNGLQLVSKVREDYPDVELIIISSGGSIDKFVEGTSINSFDYIQKPKNRNDLFNALKRGSKQLNNYKNDLAMSKHGSLIPEDIRLKIGRDFIGSSKAMHKVRNLALLAAREKDVNILITGENGTGKEIIAQVIHYGSPRSASNFCPVNSAAIPDSLLESEFFGHKKGSFTGAIEDKKGCFEMADKGTLFLDEISEMPYGLQAKLLRAIEEKKIKPIGCNHEIKVDFRIISATNNKLEELTTNQKLRIDLFYRLNTFIINIPPLRSRPEDIKPLVDYYVEKIALSKNIEIPIIQPNIYKHLANYNFPGNIRELKNMVERAIIICNGNQLKIKDFQFDPIIEFEQKISKSCNIEANEKKLIAFALHQTNNNNTKAAKLLGISRDTLFRKKKKFHIG